MVKEQQVEYVNCNLCGANDYNVVYPARYDLEAVPDLASKFKSSGDERLVDQVVQCKQCGLRYVNPRLNIKLVVQGYSEGSDETFISQAEGRERTFERQLKKIEPFVQKGKVLDIGTAGGSFLAVAKKRGWQVDGIEPNKWLCNWGKEHYGIDIKPGVLEDYNLPDNHYDLVTLWDVLEHTGDPKSVLKECSRILRPGGVLVVNIPDISTLVHKVMGRKWVFYLSVHLFYFNKKTATKMLEDAGFKVFKIKPHIQSLELGYLMHRAHTYSPAISKIGKNITNLLHMGKVKIPYWLGQTLVLARKE